jgi:hypothetical protein
MIFFGIGRMISGATRIRNGAKLRGPLDEPNVTIGGQPFQRRQEPAPSGEPAPAAEETPKQQPVKPEDLLKDGLKNLLKGLGG